MSIKARKEMTYKSRSVLRELRCAAIAANFCYQDDFQMNPSSQKRVAKLDSFVKAAIKHWYPEEFKEIYGDEPDYTRDPVVLEAIIDYMIQYHFSDNTKIMGLAPKEYFTKKVLEERKEYAKSSAARAADGDYRSNDWDDDD